MDPKAIESELRFHKIREGPIYKRTKFLQEWRERWMVITMNYILIFTNRNLKELAQFIDLQEVEAYKSYLRKDEDMIPAGFKIGTREEMFYFCARNCNEKWTWIVSLERVMDFKYAGKSPYNNSEWIKTKGFMGQSQFERGKFDQPEYEKPKEPEKPKEVEKKKEELQNLGVTESDLKNKLKLLDEEMKSLRNQSEQMHRKQREQQEIFLFELNKLKKAEESLRELQLQVEEKAREVEKVLSEHQPRQIIKQVYIERPVQGTMEKPVEVEKKEETHTHTEKTEAQSPTGQPEKREDESPGNHPVTSKQSSISKHIEQMKKFYESKEQKPTSGPQSAKVEKKVEKKDDMVALQMCRDRVVVNLLQEFHTKAYSYPGLRYILQFLVDICSERSLGYQSYLIREAKAHQNRFLFAQVLLELINDYKKYEKFGCLARIIEVLIFQVPGIFKQNHFDLIKRKLVDLLFHVPEMHGDMPILLKTLYVVHKNKPLQKNQELKEKLSVLAQKMISSEGKNWARKLVEDL